MSQIVCMTHLQAVADGVWTARVPQRFYGLELGARLTALRTAPGQILVFSPIRLDDALATELEALGEVRDIVLPNKYHHLYAAPYLERFPGARLFGAEGLATKRPDLKLAELGDGRAPDWPGCRALLVRGMPAMNEVVLLHEPSATLLVADLAFNLRQREVPRLTRWYLKFSKLDGFGQTGLIRAVTKDRAALKASLDSLLALPFDRVIVCHGDVLESGGVQAMEQAFSWL